MPRRLFTSKTIGCWFILVTIAYFLFPLWIGLTLTVISVLVLLLVFPGRRSNPAARRSIWTVLTTHCAQCGMWPISHKNSRAPSSGFLLCEKCGSQVEGNVEIGRVDFEVEPFIRSILEQIETSIQTNQPPEIRKTVQRLTGEGYSADEARLLVSTAATVEVFHAVYDQEPSDQDRFFWNLAHLPRKPWDAEGKEYYQAQEGTEGVVS
jgi:hypothetical protein